MKRKRGHAQAAELEEPTKCATKCGTKCLLLLSMPHFVAFFVARVVVYASSQDFVATALGQPYSTQLGIPFTLARSYLRRRAFAAIVLDRISNSVCHHQIRRPRDERQLDLIDV